MKKRKEKGGGDNDKKKYLRSVKGEQTKAGKMVTPSCLGSKRVESEKSDRSKHDRK